MKKEIPMIEVLTLQNGYSLRFSGMTQSGGYMYFTPDKLLEGFMLHIGLGMTEQLNVENMQDFIVAAINWKDNAQCVKEIGRLTQAIKVLKGRRASVARRLVQERSNRIGLIEDLSSLISMMKGKADKDIIEKAEKIRKAQKKPYQYSLESLGVSNNDFIDENDDDDDDE